VDIATRYVMEGLGIESRWGVVFRSLPEGFKGPHSLLYNGQNVSFPEVKQPGHDFDHPHPSSAEVQERVEL
jgi:hypothetical protein